MFSSAALLLLVAGLAMCSGYMFNRGLKTVTRYDIALNEQLGIVTMYMKETCPFCKEAKALLVDKYGLKLSLVDVEEPDR